MEKQPVLRAAELLIFSAERVAMFFFVFYECFRRDAVNLIPVVLLCETTLFTLGLNQIDPRYGISYGKFQMNFAPMFLTERMALLFAIFGVVIGNALPRFFAMSVFMATNMIYTIWLAIDYILRRLDQSMEENDDINYSSDDSEDEDDDGDGAGKKIESELEAVLEVLKQKCLDLVQKEKEKHIKKSEWTMDNPREEMTTEHKEEDSNDEVKDKEEEEEPEEIEQKPEQGCTEQMAEKENDLTQSMVRWANEQKLKRTREALQKILSPREANLFRAFRSLVQSGGAQGDDEEMRIPRHLNDKAQRLSSLCRCLLYINQDLQDQQNNNQVLQNQFLRSTLNEASRDEKYVRDLIAPHRFFDRRLRTSGLLDLNHDPKVV